MSFLKKVVKEVKSTVTDSKSAPAPAAQPAAAPAASAPTAAAASATPPTSSKPALQAAATSKPTSIAMPKTSKNAAAAAPEGGSRTPRTPADEGIAFFEGPVGRSEGPIQVFELDLEADGSPTKEKSYIRLPPPHPHPYVLRISLEPGTPATRNGVLKSDFPLDGGKFERYRWSERKLPTDFSKPIHIDLPISQAGSFAYFIEYDAAPSVANPNGPRARLQSTKGFFSVDPIIRLPVRSPILSAGYAVDPKGGAIPPPSEAKLLPLDGLAILSVIAKWQGKLSGWDAYLDEASRRGYNMLHFTPLQTRGDSGSPYSIWDQLKFDPELFAEAGTKSIGDGVAEIGAMVKKCREQYGLLSLTDVVLNHTANNSPWLEDHPESGYNVVNSPHLTPALELDSAILELSAKLAERGLPTTISSEGDLATLRTALDEVINDLKLYEYYAIDVAAHKQTLEAALGGKASKAEWKGPVLAGRSHGELAALLRSEPGAIEGLGRFEKRWGVHVPTETAVSFVVAAFGEDGSPTALADEWAKVLDIVNVDQYKEFNADGIAQRDNVISRVKYERLEEGGPRLGKISAESPMVGSYFTRLPANAKTQQHNPASLALANNGWIWDADPLANFAERPSKAYLRREVIVWGDCVKLRYGRKPEDNPWLWDHMTKYCELLAGMFDGFRLDNCHSTPLQVGIAMIDAGRKRNPNLYVVAELFTGSEEMDLLFIKNLGINSLIREMMNGFDPKEQSRLLYRFGVGKPIGSMDGACLTSPDTLPSPTGKGPSRPCTVTPLFGSAPHACMMDVTHDNQSPLDKRTAEDALSTGALATFCFSAIGSNKGFDDLYPKLLDLVSDTRMYEVGGEGVDRGIGRIKRILNHLHTEMVLEGFTEGHVHQENDYIVLHRVHPQSHKGYLLVAHTAFNKNDLASRGSIAPIKLSRQQTKYITGASIKISSYEDAKDPKTLKGLPSTLIDVPMPKQNVGEDAQGRYTEIVVPDEFPPGSVMLFATHMIGVKEDLDTLAVSGADEAFKALDLVDLNVLLHRCDEEERDATGGDGVYEVPGYGKLVYCGLQGWMAPLKPIIRNNDLGAPLCEHLRQGFWALDYVTERLERQLQHRPNLKAPLAWFQERFAAIKATVPSFLRPKYFALVMYEAYKAARRAVVEQCSEFISSGHSFTQDLALCAVQMYGLVTSASIDPAKPVPSLAAGLTHFTTEWARCWGRDVFISLRGLFLTTGAFPAARDHILAFGSVLKHGLVPNLLDSCRTPRYNCRDGPWWFIQNIQDYVNKAPNGLAILSDSVKRRFPADDTWVAWDDARAYAYSSTVAELIQEIVQRHASGIEFREYNAGPNLDMQMDDRGFDQKIYTDWSTGFIHGGNEYNCGTWMDKMGSSAKAGNKGLPATPRDGAPVEITALLKSSLRWLAELSTKGDFPFKGVDIIVDGKKTLLKYQDWGDLIQANFEKYYHVPADPADDAKYVIQSNLVNRRGIYKDVVGSGAGREWSDYQLRSNYPIAMIVAPELFTPEKALGALQAVDQHLRGPLGMKTLDPSDSQYRGDYDNANDGTDRSVAQGWNYHQGPEWVFPTGWFLKAYLMFDTRVGLGKDDPSDSLHYVSEILLEHRRHVATDPWAGLPELTNSNGGYCHDSCRTQAWSASTILDVLEEMAALASGQNSQTMG